MDTQMSKGHSGHLNTVHLNTKLLRFGFQMVCLFAMSDVLVHKNMMASICVFRSPMYSDGALLYI